MNEQSKRRLIGGIVVLLFIGILSFFLFRDAGTLEELSEIPPAPEFTRIEIRNLEPPPEVKRIEQKLAEVKENRIKEADRKKEKEPIESPKEEGTEAIIKDSLDEIVFNEKGIPKRWVVQTASYKSERNAEKFKKLLADKGFPSMMRKVGASSENVFYVVYVGPVLRRSKAQEYKQKVDKTYNTQGIIREWN